MLSHHPGNPRAPPACECPACVSFVLRRPSTPPSLGPWSVLPRSGPLFVIVRASPQSALGWTSVPPLSCARGWFLVGIPTVRFGSYSLQVACSYGNEYFIWTFIHRRASNQHNVVCAGELRLSPAAVDVHRRQRSTSDGADNGHWCRRPSCAGSGNVR